MDGHDDDYLDFLAEERHATLRFPFKGPRTPLLFYPPFIVSWICVRLVWT
jgi:hypothetical protein